MLSAGDELVFSGTWVSDAADISLHIYSYDENTDGSERLLKDLKISTGEVCRFEILKDGRYRIDLEADYPVSEGTMVLGIC